MTAVARGVVAGVALLGALAHDALAQRTTSAVTRPWSLRMSESVIRRNPAVSERWDYTAGFVLLGIERVGQARNDPRLLGYVTENMERFVQPDGSIRTYRQDEFNLDQINQGRLLFPLHARTKDDRYRKAADQLREQLRRHPRTSEGGFWHKQIYPHQMWLDGLYMAEPFYAEYAASRGGRADFADVAKQFFLAARHTRDARTGLLYHAWDESHKQRWADSLTGQSPHVWGRAVGWYLMGLVDVLDYLPADDPSRPALIGVLRDAAEAVRKVQDPATGVWYQILDQPSRTGNYLEASASSMFVYALAKGARKGYLDASYREAASRGFNGLVAQFVTVDPDGLVSLNGICKVAGLGGRPYRDGTFDYYVREPVVANDYKGVGAFIMASLELNR
jgi:unsaturated rhamnogalacturonyl hydrolase